jgi:LuxR family transcriptional regulator, maltose regulon positive regulatory protein
MMEGPFFRGDRSSAETPMDFRPWHSRADRDQIARMGGVRARNVSEGGPLPVPRSKFGCPAVPARAIARPRLAEVLAQPDWRVALVTGGPATGKTVIVAQWFETLGPITRGWVTLDASDDRPERFWLTFALALERAVPGAFAQAVASATDVHRLPPEFLNRLLAAWSAVEEPLVVVLDDMHHLRSPEISEDLGFVVEHLPGRSRIVLTSRADPRLPVSRWRGRGWLAELRQRDLALTLPETAGLFTALGEHRLTTSDIEVLWRHSEGWVAGLRLAAAGLKDRADVSAAVAEFSGRTPMVADLLADELLHRAPRELSEFLLRTSVADVLDAELCDALSGRSDSGEVLRRMEADLQFVMATGPSRDTYRYHPLLAEMLRSELATHRQEEVHGLNRLAAVILEGRGDIAGAARCLLAAGDTDRAFSIVYQAAYRRADLCDIPGIAAFVNLFPRELVTESASRMLTYALMLGLSGQVAEAHAWLQRARVRIGNEPEPRAEDVATLDVLRLLTFAVTAEAGDEIDAGRRAVAAVESGLDIGVGGARARMNLVRGYLLVDKPDEADSTLRAGSPGDEIAALVLVPALAARIALRRGRLCEAERQARAALQAAHAFGLGTHTGALDAHLALAGVLIDRNELADVFATFRLLDEIILAWPEARVYQVLLRLEKVRAAAAQGDFDDVFATLREAGMLIAHVPRSALRRLVDAVAARWHLQAGQTRQAEGLIATLPDGSPALPLLRARLDLAHGRFDAVKDRIGRASLTTMRDRLAGRLLLARAAIESGEDAAGHVMVAVGLAAPERLVRVFLEEGAAVARVARAAAESLGTEPGTNLAVALGSPPLSRGTARQPAAILTERELSVLRFLASHLTAAGIARECFLSVNTVKSHMKSIYAKLGTSSRSETVDRARLLGLL